MTISGRVPGILDLPETNVALFGFLLNFPCEIWQVPFFERMARVAAVAIGGFAALLVARAAGIALAAPAA